MQPPEDPYYVRTLEEMSRSGMEHFLRSPAHFFEWVRAEDQITEALRFGQAFHCAVLEPHKFESVWSERPNFGDCRYGENKRARDAWLKEHEGKRTLTPEQMKHLTGMVASVKKHKYLRAILKSADTEVEVHWSENQCNFKSKLDAVRPDIKLVLELKSCQDAGERPFKRDVFTYGYHRQEAFYRRATRTAGWEPRFVFAACEKTPPYGVKLYRLRREWVQEAESELERAVVKYQECMASQTWPSYTEGIEDL